MCAKRNVINRGFEAMKAEAKNSALLFSPILKPSLMMTTSTATKIKVPTCLSIL